MLSPKSDTCHLCGAEVANLKNHVRMSDDAQHGPQGRYPDDEPTQGTEPPEIGDSVLRLDLDGDREAGDVDGGEDVDTLELADRPADASEYECGECGGRLEYHQDTCECGKSPMWRAPVNV